MARLSAYDQRQLAELVDSLRCWRPGERPTLESVMLPVRSLLDTDRFGGYSVKVDTDSVSPDVVASSGSLLNGSGTRERVESFMRRSGRRPGGYDAARPEPEQRNRVFLFPPTLAWLDELERDGGEWERRLGVPDQQLQDHLRAGYASYLRPIGMDRHQMRLIVSDGESMLAYLAAAQEEPFTDRQRLLLTRLRRPLRDRLQLEQQLRGAPLAAAALEAALEAVALPAFLVSGNGLIRARNAAGRVLGDQLGPVLAEALRASIAGRPSVPAFRLSRIEVPGFPCYYLAVQQPGAGDDSGRLAAATARWGLTRRQTEVLARLARGQSNKEVAVALGLGQSTVELHVTNLLDKVEVSSRSELIARYWTLS